MKRFLIAVALLLTLSGFLIPLPARSTPSTTRKPECADNAILCTEVLDSIGYNGAYTGHDEPSVLFYSNVAGSGNSNTYMIKLPTDPPILPVQDGSGGTFNFQLRPTFWFGMALCDDQSAPNPSGSFRGANVPCTPNSDSNIFTSPDPTNPNFIGLHPGTAFMEMQMYPPGWAPWPAGNSCDALQWCAAMTIDSFSLNQNTGVALNPTCQNMITGGVEYVNFAFITTSGVAHAPANPLTSTLATFTPNKSTDFFMNSGDVLKVDLHDTTDGFQVVINDLTAGTTGSMTASVANGFGQIQYAPSPSTSCTEIPAAYHPMYSTSSEDTRVVWAAHSYNIAFSDEIGHFEYCNGVNPITGACNAKGITDPSGLDRDDIGCFSPANSLRVRISGCIFTDGDFDGPEYQATWPGTFTDPELDSQFHAAPVLFTTPSSNGNAVFNRVAFEADLPRIEVSAISPNNNCNRTTGVGCVNPPNGASFYPIYTTGSASFGTCVWQLGGPFIPGTSNTFGGNSAAEYGPLLKLTYPAATTSGITMRFNDFRNVLGSNPC